MKCYFSAVLAFLSLSFITHQAFASTFGRPLNKTNTVFEYRSRTANLRKLFPEIKPYKTGRLNVGDGHNLYFEEAGNPKGHPVIVLHGGPGGGINPAMRQFFNPRKWRIILLDQRGAGQSTPFSELHKNDTWSLVSDLEKLRKHLNISKWAVFGGSWGATLAIAYGERHDDRITGIVMRGVFLGRKQEIDWLYKKGGASRYFPEEWERFENHIPKSERKNLVKAYYQRLTSPDSKIRFDAAVAWTRWELSISKLYVNHQGITEIPGDKRTDAFARIEAHYMINHLWLKKDELLKNAKKIKNIPTYIVQGRYDTVCPPESAFDLHQKLDRSTLIFTPDSGHSMSEPATLSALVESIENLENALRKPGQ